MLPREKIVTIKLICAISAGDVLVQENITRIDGSPSFCLYVFLSIQVYILHYPLSHVFLSSIYVFTKSLKIKHSWLCCFIAWRYYKHNETVRIFEALVPLDPLQSGVPACGHMTKVYEKCKT